MSWREADLERLRTVPIARRANKVAPELLSAVPGSDRSFSAFLESLPDVLAARDLRRVAAAIVEAARAGKGVVLLLGGHVIKVGLGPLLIEWLRRGIVTHVAMNGAAAIHDFDPAKLTRPILIDFLSKVTPAMIRAVVPHGTPRRLAEIMKGYLEAGVEVPNFLDYGAMAGLKFAARSPGKMREAEDELARLLG